MAHTNLGLHPSPIALPAPSLASFNTERHPSLSPKSFIRIKKSGMSNPNEMKEFSCYACRQRKVKCDRREPCANCVRADAACEYVQPTRGKRTKTKPPRESLHAKIARYERILEKHGEGLTPSLDHDGQSSVAESVIATPATHAETAVRRQHASAPNPPSQAQAISTEPSSRYFDRYSLATSYTT